MAYTTIDKPTDYFNTVTYSGTGSNQSITGVGFQPDFIWGKGRTLAGYNHGVVDSVRGTGKNIYTNLTEAEETYSTGITSFDSDGFSVGSGNVFNNGSNTYVAWNWLASNTTASNTTGSINSTVSANTTSGFSIVSYTGNSTTGATVGHGLNQTPDMVVIKSRGHATDWQTWFTGFGTGSGASVKRIYLNQNYALGGLSANSFYPDSNVINMNSGDHFFNSSSYNYIAYCFHSVKGFSKFGSYTGNGSTDGTFVYTGFKPAWFMTKRTDSANSWVMFDNKRSSSGGFNEIDYSVNANSNGVEETSNTSSDVDFCSNGIKITEDNGAINASGGSYIYMSFSENPFVTSTGIPATAR